MVCWDRCWLAHDWPFLCHTLHTLRFDWQSQTGSDQLLAVQLSPEHLSDLLQFSINISLEVWMSEWSVRSVAAQLTLHSCMQLLATLFVQKVSNGRNTSCNVSNVSSHVWCLDPYLQLFFWATSSKPVAHAESIRLKFLRHKIFVIWLVLDM